MKDKILTIFMVWLVVATAAATSIAFAKYSKKKDISADVAAKVNVDSSQEKDLPAEEAEIEGITDIKIEEEVESVLDDKETILKDLDSSMEKIIFEES